MARLLPEYLSSEHSETAVVFVHGLGGSYTTWKNFVNVLSQEWKEKGSFGLHYDNFYKGTKNIPIYSFFVKSFIGKSIEQLSDHLDSYIRATCKYYKNIILICHSMGGLIARKYIVNLLSKDKSLGKIKGLITYATPHLGSKIANICKAILCRPLSIFQFGSLKLFSQIKDLSKDSPIINSINNDWNNLRINSKLKFIRVLGLADYIVNEQSAQFEYDRNDVFQFANKDHFTIIKPDTNNKDGALYVTYNYLKDFNDQQYEENNEHDEYPEETEYDY